LWERNFNVLKTHYPELAKVLLKEKATAEVCRAASGKATIKIDGVFIHSMRDPEREALRLVEAVLNAESGNGAIVILGFGLGYAALAAHRLSPKTPLIIVEKRSCVFRAALQNTNLFELFDKGRAIFVLDGDGGGVLAALQAAGNIRAVIRNQNLLKLDMEYYSTAEHYLELWREKERINAATLRRFGKRWVRNLAANMDMFRDLPGINNLAKAFDFPVLVLAAGPSLDRLAPFLPGLYRRCVIVAVDTALRFLAHHGITADFAVSADPQYWNLLHLLLEPFPAESLVCCASVQRRSFFLAKNTFLISPKFPLGRFIEKAVGEKGCLDAGGSVATSAFDFARRIRGGPSKPIIIAGLDLAFPQLKTHYKGARFEENMLARQGRFWPAELSAFLAVSGASPFWAKSASGGTVLTDRRLSLYAKWFEKELLCAKNEVYALFDDGLAIAGLTRQPVEMALGLKPCRESIEACKTKLFAAIAGKFSAPEESAARARRYKIARTQLEDGLKMLADGKTPVASEIRDIAGFLSPVLNEAESAAFHLKALGY
jgi:hypothetical protein